MKKHLAWLIALSLVMSLFAGCTRGFLSSESNSSTEEDSGNSDSAYGYDSMDDAIAGYLEISIGCKEPSKATVKRANPKERWDYAEEEEGNDFDEMYEELIAETEEVRDGMQSIFGRSYTISFDIIEKEKITGDDLEDIRDAFADTGMDPDKVTKAYNLELEITVEGDEESTLDATGGVYEYDGRWYVEYLSVDTSDASDSGYYGY